MSLMEIIQREKSIMRSYRYRFNRNVMIVTFIILALVIPVALLAEMNEDKFIILVYTWLGLAMVHIVSMILFGKHIANREFRDELEILNSIVDEDITSYNFPIECVNLYSNQRISFQLSEFQYMGETFSYSDFTYYLITVSTLRVLQTTIRFDSRCGGSGFSIAFNKDSFAMFRLVNLVFEHTPSYQLFCENRRQYVKEHITYGMTKEEWRKICFFCRKKSK